MAETGEIADAVTACVVKTMNTSTEAVVEIETSSFYASGVENVVLALAAIFILLIIVRLGALFVAYIRTGDIGDFQDDSFVYNTLDGDNTKILPALVVGTFPGAILIDIIGFIIITTIAGLIWPALTILLPLMAVAYLIRLPIARKQEFIGRLDGTYDGPEE